MGVSGVSETEIAGNIAVSFRCLKCVVLAFPRHTATSESSERLLRREQENYGNFRCFRTKIAENTAYWLVSGENCEKLSPPLNMVSEVRIGVCNGRIAFKICFFLQAS